MPKHWTRKNKRLRRVSDPVSSASNPSSTPSNSPSHIPSPSQISTSPPQISPSRHLLLPSHSTIFNMAEEKSLKDTFASINATVPSCVILPTTPAIQFEIRPATIGMLPSFHGLARESPYNHLGKFLSVCATFKNQNLDDENVGYFPSLCMTKLLLG